ncbi:MAG: DUF3458 domain-containing protein [Sphingomonadales bacterium]
MTSGPGYTPPPIRLDDVALRFELDARAVRVRCRLRFVRAPNDSRPLVLHGEALTLVSVTLDGRDLDPEQVHILDDRIEIADMPERGVLTVVNMHAPGTPGMMGLIRIGETLITHCEPEGFRRIAYFPDRPDLFARFRCTMIADAALYPTLLSNGRRVGRRDLRDGRHVVVYEDRRPKPSYLFALAAGRFAQARASFVARSGRTVALVAHASSDIEFCANGLETMRRALAWDERVYGRVYDGETYNMVVVPSYPGGAMENSTLNLYSTEFFMTDPAISVDAELQRIASSVAHEFFHDWTGNHVGVREWRELTLKEGMTVLREQQFMGALIGEADARINAIEKLEEQQYPEDDGTLAHAPRPLTAPVASNLYTRTVYEKGAEIWRMAETMLSPSVFAERVGAFLDRFDGEARTVEDLLDTLDPDDAREVGALRGWFEHAGPCHVTAATAWDADRNRLLVTLTQSASGGAGPLTMPVRLKLFTAQGRVIAPAEECVTDGEIQVIFRKTSQVVAVEGVTERPIVSLFRGLSAPVRLTRLQESADLLVLARHDHDAVCRWQASRALVAMALAEAEAGEEGSAWHHWHDLYDALLADGTAAETHIGRILEFPRLHALLDNETLRHIDRRGAALTALRRSVVNGFGDQLRERYCLLRRESDAANAFGARRMRSLCRALLALDPRPDDSAGWLATLDSNAPMEEAASTLRALIDLGGDLRDEALRVAQARWRDVPHKLDNWFASIGQCQSDDAATLCAWAAEQFDFDLANAPRTKALLDQVGRNPHALHSRDGTGYRLVGKMVAALAPHNSGLAARFAKALTVWPHLDPERRAIAHRVVGELAGIEALSPQLRERLDRLAGVG